MQKQTSYRIVNRPEDKLHKVERETADLMSKVMDKLLFPLKDIIYTVTSSNGKEFAMQEETDYYFHCSYPSYERGLDENTDELIRQYFPKDTGFRKITDEELLMAMKEPNNRFGKILGYLTPDEVFYKRCKIEVNIQI